MGRSPCCDKSKVKRGTWSPEEDEALKNYIAKHGTAGNWIALPHKAGLLRCGKSCRLRWLNYLRPDIRHGAFTQEEKDIICNLYNRIGSRWSVIASQLQGRTDNDVKNYWNTKIKKKVVSRGTNLPTQSSAENATIVAVAGSSTTTTPADFQASTFTVANEHSSSFTLPKFSLEDSNDFTSAYSNFPLSPSHQGSSFFDSFGFEMNENYGGNGVTTDEGFGDYGTADLFSIFQS